MVNHLGRFPDHLIHTGLSPRLCRPFRLFIGLFLLRCRLLLHPVTRLRHLLDHLLVLLLDVPFHKFLGLALRFIPTLPALLICRVKFGMILPCFQTGNGFLWDMRFIMGGVFSVRLRQIC